MKRTLALLLALVMLLGMLPMSAFADTPADTPTITFTHDADPSTLKVGEEFTVTATLANNPGFGAFQLDLNWNKSVVEFQGFAMKYSEDLDMDILDAQVDKTPNTLNHADGIMVIGKDKNNTKNGVLFKAKFKVLKEGDPAITHDADFFQLKKIIMNDDGTSSGQFEEYTVTFDMNALENLIISHVHDYTSAVTPPTCTDGGYTTYSCTCGDSYTGDNTPATGHTNVNGTCSVCGAALTVIPAGAPFLDMMTSDGKAVTITDLGPDPQMGFGTLYKVEVPMGTTQVDVTYNQGDAYVDNFGYAKTYVFNGVNGTIEDGYKAEIKDGKTSVGLEMVKSAANGTSGTIYLLNTPYPADPYELVYAGLGKSDMSNIHFFAFTYKMEEGQYGVSLPKSFMYTVTGDPVATGSYTFNVAMKNGYEASETFAVKVNGEVFATEPGEITVDSVTEELIITVEGVKKIYNPATDISITVDLTEYTGEVNGSLSYNDRAGNTYGSNLIPGKRNTVVMEASQVWQLFAYINSIGSDVVGYDINGEIRDPGYLSFGFNVRDNAQPGAYVIKPIVGNVEEKEPTLFTVTANGETVTPEKGDPAECEQTGYEVNQYILILPAGTTSITLTDESGLTIYEGCNGWPAICDGETSCTLTVSEEEKYYCLCNNAEGDDYYAVHLFVVVEEGSTEPDTGLGFTVTANGETVVPVADGEDTCMDMFPVEKYTVTLPAGTTSFTLTSDTENNLFIYKEDRTHVCNALTYTTEYTGETFYCLNGIHLYVTIAESEQPTSNPITEIEISHPCIQKDETTGALSMAMVTGASEQINVKTVLENAELDATQVVVWSSSNESVATVVNGKVTAVGAGSAVITAKAVDTSGVAAAAEGEEVLAQFTLTVSDPTAGYTVTMGEDKTVDAGETIQIPVTVGYNAAENETAPTTYKSYELTFQYDTDLLTLVTGSSDAEGKDVTVVDDNGTVTIRRYGEALNVGAAAVTLEFTANKTGESDVKLTSAKIGTSADAQDQNIPDAAIIDNLTKITVTGYDVDLDEAFTGAEVADPSEDYTFTANNNNYVYTAKVTVTKAGNTTKEFTLVKGVYTIPKEEITGSIKIEVAEREGKTVTVRFDGDSKTAVNQVTSAQFDVPYVLTAAEGYNLSDYAITYQVGAQGEVKTFDDTYTIPGIEITDNITIVVNADEPGPDTPAIPDNHWGITFEGNAVEDIVKTDGKLPTSVEKNGSFSFTINNADDYTYVVSYKMGEDGEYLDLVNGAYTISPVTNTLVITVNKWKVEVNQYVTLDGKDLFLVAVDETVAEGSGMRYGEDNMYLKSVNDKAEDGKYTGEAHQKYVYLVEVTANETLTVADAAKQLNVMANVNCPEIAVDYNVNGSSTRDINDAQLVYDMYNNVYQNMTTVGIVKFLRADLNGDRTIGVADAATVINDILTNS